MSIAYVLEYSEAGTEDWHQLQFSGSHPSATLTTLKRFLSLFVWYNVIACDHIKLFLELENEENYFIKFYSLVIREIHAGHL